MQNPKLNLQNTLLNYSKSISLKENYYPNRCRKVKTKKQKVNVKGKTYPKPKTTKPATADLTSHTASI